MIASLLSSDLESEDLALKSRDSQISADALLARQLASGSSSSSPSSSPSLVSLATVRILRDAIQTGVVKANKMILDTLRNPMPEGHDDANDDESATSAVGVNHHYAKQTLVSHHGVARRRDKPPGREPLLLHRNHVKQLRVGGARTTTQRRRRRQRGAGCRKKESEARTKGKQGAESGQLPQQRCR